MGTWKWKMKDYSKIPLIVFKLNIHACTSQCTGSRPAGLCTQTQRRNNYSWDKACWQVGLLTRLLGCFVSRSRTAIHFSLPCCFVVVFSPRHRQPLTGSTGASHARRRKFYPSLFFDREIRSLPTTGHRCSIQVFFSVAIEGAEKLR